MVLLLGSHGMNWHQGNGPLLRHAGLNLRSIFDITGQLTTGSIDVITTGFAHSGHQAGVLKHFCKSLNTNGRGTQQTGGWKWIKRNQVELATQA
jgi:hypothetical protein